MNTIKRDRVTHSTLFGFTTGASEYISGMLRQILHVISESESRKDVEPLFADERKLGLITYRFEIRDSMVNGTPALRFSTTEFKGSGKTGRTTKAFHWPMQKQDEELRAMIQRLISATAPEAEKHDHRTGFGRFFDKLTRVELINHLPALAEQPGAPRHWIEATIRQETAGRIVTLTEKRKGRGPIWMRVPLETFEILDRKFRESDPAKPDS